MSNDTADSSTPLSGRPSAPSAADEISDNNSETATNQQDRIFNNSERQVEEQDTAGQHAGAVQADAQQETAVAPQAITTSDSKTTAASAAAHLQNEVSEPSEAALGAPPSPTSTTPSPAHESRPSGGPALALNSHQEQLQAATTAADTGGSNRVNHSRSGAGELNRPDTNVQQSEPAARRSDQAPANQPAPDQNRSRNQAPANLLPSAIPPPARVHPAAAARAALMMGDADGGSSTSSQASPVIAAEKRALGDAARGARALEDESGIGGGGDELELSVPSHQEHLTSDGQRYTTYEIVVRFGGRQWSVRKRYSQFDSFRHSLRKQHKEVGSFRFPNKSKFNTFSEHTKERRRTGFDEFLRLVAGLHPRPQEVDVFLAMDEHGAGVHSRVAGRPLAWTSGSVSPVPPAASGPALPGWPEGLRPGEAKRLDHIGPGRSTARGMTHRVPRFPPLADQGRTEKAAEAAAAAMATASSTSGPSDVVREVDQLLRRVLGPDLLSVLCVVAVSAVSIVAVWKVGGKPGIATLVIAVSVGLFIQNWDRGVDVLNMGLEVVGLSMPENPEAGPLARAPTGSQSADTAGRSRAGSAQVPHPRQASTGR